MAGVTQDWIAGRTSPSLISSQPVATYLHPLCSINQEPERDWYLRLPTLCGGVSGYDPAYPARHWPVFLLLAQSKQEIK